MKLWNQLFLGCDLELGAASFQPFMIYVLVSSPLRFLFLIDYLNCLFRCKFFSSFPEEFLPFAFGFLTQLIQILSFKL